MRDSRCVRPLREWVMREFPIKSWGSKLLKSIYQDKKELVRTFMTSSLICGQKRVL